MAWPCNLSIFPHSFQTLALGVVDRWRILKDQSTSLFYSRSLYNSPSLERKGPVWDAHSHYGLCVLASCICVMSEAACLQMTLNFLTLFFFSDCRCTRSEARTGVNTVPTSCGGSSPKGSGAQVDTELSLSFSIYVKCHQVELETSLQSWKMGPD